MSELDYIAYGRHVLADVSDADADTLNDVLLLEEALISAAVAEGVTVLGTLKHSFSPSGVTILLLLAESHVSLHTYPELGKAFFDAFTCGENFHPINIFQTFASQSLFKKYKITQIERGWGEHSSEKFHV